MIHSFEWAENNNKKIGKVTHVTGSVIWAEGLVDVFVGESVVSEDGTAGMVVRADEAKTEVVCFEETTNLINQKIVNTGEPISVSVGDHYVGYIWDALGHTYGGKEDSKETDNKAVDIRPARLNERRNIDADMETGVAILDTLMPLACGQRELLIGDVGTGKTTMALQVLARQIELGAIGVLCLSGKQRTEIQKAIKYLRDRDVLDKCVVIAEPADSSAGRIYLTPFTAMTMAEFFRDRGKDVVVVIDDLSTHATRYREIALNAERFPGRDSYPSDVFWTHARLMERAGNFRVDGKDVSISCIPIIETIDSSLTGYIETNLMSMTDGHIYMDKKIYQSGQRPAVNPFLSVTRVGRQTQNQVLKGASHEINKLFQDHENLKNFMKFSYELNDNAKRIVEQYGRVQDFFCQSANEKYSIEETAWVIAQILAGRDGVKLLSTRRNDAKYTQTAKTVFEASKSWEDYCKAVAK
jgi:F-type H+/Na+-transporting ATPase subunit alpha